jgi:hypothetical protein
MGDEQAAFEVALPAGSGDLAAALVAELPAGAALVAADLPNWALVVVAAASTPVLTRVSTFIRGRLGMGLTLDLAVPTPRLAATEGLAAGTLRTVKTGGEESLRSALSDQQLGYLLRAGLATRGR